MFESNLKFEFGLLIGLRIRFVCFYVSSCPSHKFSDLDVRRIGITEPFFRKSQMTSVVLLILPHAVLRRNRLAESAFTVPLIIF